MSLDLPAMLDRVVARQWHLDQIEWDAPGADRITDEQRPKLKSFMADLVWIEHVGARGFQALQKQAEDPTLKEIYGWFHLEEQRHARAEMELMRRWDMLGPGEIPRANTSLRFVMDWLERYADDQPMVMLGTIIPLLEVALDGALLKFLLDEVHDPLCHAVFDRINNDESRHLAVDFHVLGELRPDVGAPSLLRVARGLKPELLLGGLIFLPLISQMRDNIVDMGLDEHRLYEAIERFIALGARYENTRHNRLYQGVKQHAKVFIDRRHPYHALVGDPLVRLTNLYPRVLLPPKPAWAKQLREHAA
jgi:hypothetical protein